MSVTPAEAAVLKRRMDTIHLRDEAMDTTWFKGSSIGNEGCVWMASDASDTTMAFVHLAQEGAGYQLQRGVKPGFWVYFP